MPKSFFDKQSKQPAYGKLLKENKVHESKARIAKAHQALQALKEDIETRDKKLHEILTFLDVKKMRYQQLAEQYQQKPLPTLATELNHLKQAIDDLVAKIEKTQPKKVISDLRSRYKKLQSELARKEAL
jgi:peptidoglycan hydrolase CwlO-like protein